MDKRQSHHPLVSYIGRLVREASVWILTVTGVIAIVADLIMGGTIPWPIYAAVFGLAPIVGGYFVYKDMLGEAKAEKAEHERLASELRQRLDELEDKQPRIVVGFSQHGQFVRRLTLRLHPLLTEPDYSGLVTQKRDDLLSKKLVIEQRAPPGEFAARFLIQPNANYRADVEKYLAMYETYLRERHEHTMFRDRLREVQVVVDNQGRFPADDVTIVFDLPKELPPANSRHLLWLHIGDDYEPTPPEEPKLYVNPVEGLGMPAFFGDISNRNENAVMPSNTSGPEYKTDGDKVQVTYGIKRLVHNRPEFELNPMYWWLGDVCGDQLLEIPVRVFAANLPEPQDDVLSVEIRLNAE